jgi:hypothetical protein
MKTRKLKKHTVTLQVAFISADRKNCKEDAETFGEQLDSEYEKLISKFKRKSEAGLGKIFSISGPETIEVQVFEPAAPPRTTKSNK